MSGYYHRATNTAGAAVTGNSGTLHTITINTKGATSNLLTVYDGTSTSGAVIAAIDTTANVQTLIYDVQFLVGLYIVLAAGTAADITIAFS